jgi:hypothetical protein
MRCPHCGEETPDDGWNCVSCRINLYWANKHYKDLAELREEKGLARATQSPPFLVQAHKDAADKRAASGGEVEQKVRSVARRVIDKDQS